jgi:rhamnosyl/mannosyltransferase
MAERIAALRRDGRFRVLFVGRLSRYKGLPDLVTAMQWVDGDLVLIGRGDLASELQALAAKLGIAERVQLLGRIPDEDVVCQYHAAEVAVLPSVSRGESFGLMQVEAMLCGKPVVCSDLPGVCEVGEAGVTSCTFPRGEARALADILNDLAQSPDRRRQMGAAGRQRALELYHPETVLRRRLRVYEELLGQSLVREATHGDP